MRHAKAKFLVAMILLALIWGAVVFPAGAIAPALSIRFVTPTNTATVTDATMKVTAVISGRGGSAKVDLLIDGSLCDSKQVILTTAGRGEVNFEWDTQNLSSGSHALALVARTDKGVQNSARIKIMLPENTPQVLPQIEGIRDGAVLSEDTDKVVLHVEPNCKDARNVVLLEDGKLRAVTNIAPFNFDWDTKRLDPGKHTLQAQVYDNQGNLITSNITVVELHGEERIIVAQEPTATVTEPLTSRMATPDTAARKLSNVEVAETPETSGYIVSTTPTPATKPQTSIATQPETGKPMQLARRTNWNMDLTAAPGQISLLRPAAVKPAATQSVQPKRTEAASSIASVIPAAMKTHAVRLPSPEPTGATVSLPPAPVNTNTVKPVKLPATTLPVEAVTVAVPQTHNRNNNITLHLVAPKDSLWRIARKYGISVTDLTRVNKIKADTMLQLGQRLTIPGRPALAVKGKILQNSPAPFFSDGKLMIPVRAVVEACGGKVQWSKDGHIAVKTAETNADLRVGSDKAKVAGKEITMHSQVVIREGRAFLAMEAFNEVALLPTNYQQDKNLVVIACVTRE
jgi:LysM repeat protein